MGVAKTKVDRGNGYIDTYVVARYSPRGNTSGQYTENVKEKKVFKVMNFNRVLNSQNIYLCHMKRKSNGPFLLTIAIFEL